MDAVGVEEVDEPGGKHVAVLGKKLVLEGKEEEFAEAEYGPRDLPWFPEFLDAVELVVVEHGEEEGGAPVSDLFEGEQHVGVVLVVGPEEEGLEDVLGEEALARQVGADHSDHLEDEVFERAMHALALGLQGVAHQQEGKDLAVVLRLLPLLLVVLGDHVDQQLGLAGLDHVLPDLAEGAQAAAGVEVLHVGAEDVEVLLEVVVFAGGAGEEHVFPL